MKFKDISKDLKECIKLYVKVFTSAPWNEMINEDLASKRLKFLIDMPDSKGEICLNDNKPVGFWLGYIEPVAHFKELIIKEILVNPHFQNMGIGSKMMESAEKFAKEEGCKRITLSTNIDAGAFNFYKSLGYEHLQNVTYMSKDI